MKRFTLGRLALLDVHQGALLNDASVTVSGTRIHSIELDEGELAGRPTRTSSAHVGDYVDCQGLFAVPGLIDCHVHLFNASLASQESDQEACIADPVEDSFRIADQHIAEAHASGITTVRDVGAHLRYNNRYRDSRSASRGASGPARILSCGQPLTGDGGHFADRGRLWRRETETLFDVVLDELESGADFIKVMNDDPVFSVEELREVTEICHRRAIKVACHAFTERQILVAIDAEVDTIEHAFPLSEECCTRLIERNISICPTVVAAVDSLSDLELAVSVVPDCSASEFRNWHKQLTTNLAMAFKMGVRVIAGTDAGCVPTGFNSLLRELRFYHELGASPLQAWRSATLDAALALGIEKDVGSIEAGKSADLILLAQNPLRRFPDALHEIRAVFARGYLVFSKGFALP